MSTLSDILLQNVYPTEFDSGQITEIFTRFNNYQENIIQTKTGGNSVDGWKDGDSESTSTPINATNLNLMHYMLLAIRDVIGATTDFEYTFPNDTNIKLNASEDNQPKTVASYLSAIIDQLLGDGATSEDINTDAVTTLRGLKHYIQSLDASINANASVAGNQPYYLGLETQGTAYIYDVIIRDDKGVYSLNLTSEGTTSNKFSLLTNYNVSSTPSDITDSEIIESKFGEYEYALKLSDYFCSRGNPASYYNGIKLTLASNSDVRVVWEPGAEEQNLCLYPVINSTTIDNDNKVVVTSTSTDAQVSVFGGECSFLSAIQQLDGKLVSYIKKTLAAPSGSNLTITEKNDEILISTDDMKFDAVGNSGTDYKVIATVSQSNGKISASTVELAPATNSNLTLSRVGDAIQIDTSKMELSTVGGESCEIVNSVSQSNGKISATAKTLSVADDSNLLLTDNGTTISLDNSMDADKVGDGECQLISSISQSKGIIDAKYITINVANDSNLGITHDTENNTITIDTQNMCLDTVGGSDTNIIYSITQENGKIEAASRPIVATAGLDVKHENNQIIISTTTDLDTSKVYFAENLTITEPIGLHTIPKEGYTVVQCKGKTLQQFFEEAYAKESTVEEIQLATTPPSIELFSNNLGSYEVGTNVSIDFAFINATIGKYPYGPDDTGVTWSSHSATLNGETISSIRETFSTRQITDDTNLTLTGSATYSDGVAPKTNLGKDCEAAKIQGDTKNLSVTTKLTGYRNTFYGAVNAPIEKSEDITSDFIRGLTPSNAALKKNSTFTVNLSNDTRSVIIAYPGALPDLESIQDFNDSNSNILSGFTKTTATVKGANGYEGKDYKVYYINFANEYGTTNKYTVKIGAK